MKPKLLITFFLASVAYSFGTMLPAQNTEGSIWMDYKGLGTPTFWIKVDASGDTLYVRYNKQKVLEVKKGKLGNKRREEFLRSLAAAVSHESREQADGSPRTEGDIIKVHARTNNKSRTWRAIASNNDPLYSANWFHSLLTQLRSFSQDLLPLSRAEVIRSGEISKEYESRIIAAGQFQFTNLAPESLKEYPNISKALGNAEEFIVITDDEAKFLSSLLNEHGWFYARYQGKPFHITRYIFPNPQ